MLPQLYYQLRSQIEAARAVVTKPAAVAPPPTISVDPGSIAPRPPSSPSLPGQASFPSSQQTYGYDGVLPSSAFVDYSSAPNVSTAAITPDPTALTGDNLTPAAQAGNRANLIKLVGVAALIWLILDRTGR